MTKWRRNLRPLLATLALAYLVAMAVSGAMPVQRQLVRFEPKGVLSAPAIARVEMSRGTTPDAPACGAGSGRGGGTTISALPEAGTSRTDDDTSGPVREIAAAELTDRYNAVRARSPPPPRRSDRGGLRNRALARPNASPVLASTATRSFTICLSR